MYSSKIDFEMIYIREAHAQDAWPISSSRFTPNNQPIIVNTPQTTRERVAIAARLHNEFSLHPNIKVLVDSVDHGDLFLQRFTPWPIQVFMLQSNLEEFLLYKIFHAQKSTLPLDDILDSAAEIFHSLA